MKIYKPEEMGLKPVTIRELIKDYKMDSDGNIRCYGGRLNPRPSYQREFVYDEKDQREVFKTLKKDFPLGTFYWCETEDGFELIDGQQRTLSIMNIVHGDVYLKENDEKIYWDRLPKSTQEAILNQTLNVYICKGDLQDKMEWFKTINIVGKTLTVQEIRSAVYSGPFVSDARKWFVTGGQNCQAILNDFKAFVKGNVDRQEIFEKVLYWHANAKGFEGSKDDVINAYLREHKNDKDASELWNYYDAVIKWADMLFGHDYPNEQQKVEWGLLYNKYHNKSFIPNQVRSLVDELMSNPEIDKREGVFEYVFDGEIKHLNPRGFKESDKRAKYEEQGHLCAICNGEIKDVKSAHADHIIPWSKGGRTDISNLQILCVECNLKKSNEENAEAASKYSLLKEKE